MATITERIRFVERDIQSIGADYRTAVICTARSARDFISIFSASSDNSAQDALTEFQAERARCEQEIAELERNIQITRNNIERLNSSIRTTENNINQLNQQLRRIGGEIDFARSTMNRSQTDAQRSSASSSYSSARNRFNQTQANVRSNERQRDDFVSQRNTEKGILEEQLTLLSELQSRLSQVIEIIRLF